MSNNKFKKLKTIDEEEILVNDDIENCNIEKNNSSSQNNSFLCLKSDNTSKVIADILKETKFQN